MFKFNSFPKSTPLILLPGCLRLNYHPAVGDKILHFFFFLYNEI